MFDITKCLVYTTCSQAKHLADVFNSNLMEFGISKVQWSAMYYISLYDTISVCELANKLEVKHSSATRLLGRMEQEEYIKRIKDESDRRVTYVKLTQRGLDIRNQVLPICETISKNAIEDISESDIDVFKDVLSKLVMNITENRVI